jgi:magnesium-protoporphyrin IX monomethyl ester (oxidative) cyclase
VELDIDNPAFRARLSRLWEISQGISAARAQGGLAGRAKRYALMASAGINLVRLYLLPTKSNTMPAHVRLVPAW